MELDAEERGSVAKHGTRVVHEAVASLDVAGDRVVALRLSSGEERRFEVLYSALGLALRSSLTIALGANHDAAGAPLVDDHNRTTVPGLYATRGVVRGLDQIVVTMGHAAVAATDIHNRRELPTEDEPERPAHRTREA